MSSPDSFNSLPSHLFPPNPAAAGLQFQQPALAVWLGYMLCCAIDLDPRSVGSEVYVLAENVCSVLLT
jgi:hypothetical protein